MNHPAITDYLLSQGLQFGVDFETVDRSDGIGPRLVMLHGVQVEQQDPETKAWSLPSDLSAVSKAIANTGKLAMPTVTDLDAFAEQQSVQLTQAAADKASADEQYAADIQTLKDGLSKSKDPLVQAMLRIILEKPSQVNRNLFKP